MNVAEYSFLIPLV